MVTQSMVVIGSQWRNRRTKKVSVVERMTPNRRGTTMAWLRTEHSINGVHPGYLIQHYDFVE